MDRYAIFVDAGYVYAAGGTLVLDTPNRNQIQLNHGLFVRRVREVVERDFGSSGEFLRMYWYDAAPRGMAQAEHETVGAQAGVKVRLGRLTRQGQKGVDSLVLRDMMRLSAEHAICTAFLIAGDEDLRQGVIEAQDYGVKVVLLGIQPTFGRNQAESLVHEADDLRVLAYEELEDCLEHADADRDAISLDETFDAYAIGFSFGEQTLGQVDPHQVRQIAAGAPIPEAIDREIIGQLSEVGDLPRSVRFPVGVIAQARDGFRASVRTVSSEIDTREPLTAESAVAPSPPPAAPAGSAASTQPESKIPQNLGDGQVWAFSEGVSFGRAWLNTQPEGEARYLRANFPYLPRDVDVELLRQLVTAMNLPAGAHVDDADRKAARAGFWQTLGMELDFGSPRPAARRMEPIAERDPVSFGRVFAKQWSAQADGAEVERARTLLEKGIGLPSEADGALLRMAASVFGDPVPVDIRHRLRDGFKAGLQVP